MPRIDRIHPAKRDGLMVVALDDGRLLRLSPDAVLAHRLSPGEEIPQARIDELSAVCLSEQTRRTAAAIVSAVPVTRAELVKRLIRKGCPAGEAEAARDWLCDLGVLDDAAFARSLVGQSAARGDSLRACRERLREKGVPPELIEETTADYPCQDAALDALVAKKLRGAAPDRQTAAKLTASLARKGFTYEEIRAALRRARAEADDETP